MAYKYRQPDTILSPRDAIKKVDVLFDNGEFSVAKLLWYVLSNYPQLSTDRGNPSGFPPCEGSYIMNRCQLGCESSLAGLH